MQHSSISRNSVSRRSLLKKGGLVLTSMILGLSTHACLPKTKNDADVIVIGAGLSGLNAALLLEENGYKVIIVEATDRVGGRVYTVDDHIVPGHPELGANEMGKGYARMMQAAEKYEVEIGPFRPRTELKRGEILYAIKNRLISPGEWATHALNPFPKIYKKAPPSSPHWEVYHQLNPLPKNDLTAWRKKEFAHWDIPVNKVLQDHGFSQEAIKLCQGTNSGFGIDETSLSVLMYFQMLNFAAQQKEISDGAGLAAIGGNSRIPEAMRAHFNQDVLLGAPVKGISSDKHVVTVTLENEQKLKAKYVLVTIPTSALKNVTIDPTPPLKQNKAIKELAYTPCVQIHYVVNKPYWEDGLEPSMWTDQLGGRFLALRNDPKDPNKITSCVAYLNGKVALSVDKMERQEAITSVTKSLERIRPSLKGAIRPIHYWSWSNNRFAGGAYAFWQPGQIKSFANEIALPHGRIHFAGEHTAVMNRGMEGAMESGERAAIEIMNLI